MVNGEKGGGGGFRCCTDATGTVGCAVHARAYPATAAATTATPRSVGVALMLFLLERRRMLNVA